MYSPLLPDGPLPPAQWSSAGSRVCTAGPDLCGTQVRGVTAVCNRIDVFSTDHLSIATNDLRSCSVCGQNDAHFHGQNRKSSNCNWLTVIFLRFVSNMFSRG